MIFKNAIKFLEYQNIECLIDEPIKKHTSFKIGGKCKIMVFPKSIDQFCSVISYCKTNNIKYFYFGNGSNILASDFGFDGVLINCLKFKSIKLISENEIYCECGAKLGELCKFACENELSGLEFAYGIPGSVGGAIYMNAGAYDGEIKNVVDSVVQYDSHGKIVKSSRNDLKFSYRQSVFSENGGLIISAIFKLEKANKIDVKNKMENFLKRRKLKQPLNFPSAGSVFKKPPNFHASKLIDECGLKGLKIGGAMVSEKHCGFIVNVDNASCQDVLKLIEKIKTTVKSKKGVQLEQEIINLN